MNRETFELATHLARTSPDQPVVECPRCGDPMEHLWEWERAKGDKEPPLCCSRCLTLVPEPVHRCWGCGAELEEAWTAWSGEGVPPLRCPDGCRQRPSDAA